MKPENKRPGGLSQYAPDLLNQVLATVPWAARATTRVEVKANFIVVRELWWQGFGDGSNMGDIRRLGGED